MKKLLMVCALVLLSGAGSALAQPAYEFAEAGTKNFITEAVIAAGEQISLDLWLTDVSAPQQAGGAWIDFSASTGEISYVSGGRCLAGGAEGCTGPWQNNAGIFINEPVSEDSGGGPGIVLYQVVNLGGAAPDGDGDLIVGTLTLECSAPGDAAVDLTVIPGVATWIPIDDTTVQPATLTLSPGSTTSSIPGETTSSSVPPNSTTTTSTPVITSSTTSSPIFPRPCLVEKIYGEDSVEVAFSRYLRDSVLRKTPEGRELIKVYYDWSPHLVSALEDEPALKDQAKKVLDQILILIKHEKD
jgi:hypothetical protein